MTRSQSPPLVVEVEGPYACFTRPEYKAERLSYPVMTPSAARGLLEAIFWKPEFTYQVLRIEVLRPIRWFSVRRNEVSSTLSLDWVRKAMEDPSVHFDAEADRDQRNMVGLRDVAYRIYAHIRLREHADAPEAKYRDQFRRRVERGACFSQPFLGVREFSAAFGKPTEREPIDCSEDLGIMLHSIDYGPRQETYRWFTARLDRGVLHIPTEGIVRAESGAARTGGKGGQATLLKQLRDYAPHLDLPPTYYRRRAVRWAVALDGQGRVLSRNSEGKAALESLATPENKAGIVLATPYIYRSGSKPSPMLLVDTLTFALAVPKDDTDKAETEANRRNDDYVALLREWASHTPDDPVAAAVLAFFTRKEHLNIAVPDDATPNDLVAFRVDGTWAHLTDSAVEHWQQTVARRKSSEAGEDVCLSCGETGPLLDTLPEPIKAGAIPAPSGRSRDAQLVSVNKTAQGRGGRLQLASIPICHHCGGSAVAVLNALLADENHRYRSPDSVTVWWLKHPTALPLFRAVRDARPEDIRAVYDALHKPRTGYGVTDVDANAFHSLTLSANQSRAVIRDWLDVPLREALANLDAWFADHRIQDLWSDEPKCVPLWLMARCLGRGSENSDGAWRYLKDTEPKTAERDLLTCALRGPWQRPPTSLLHRLLQRIGADGRVDLPRAALLRLLLTRHPSTDTRKAQPVLDTTNTSPAYVSGRIFAVLEALQYRALRNPETKKGPNTTIADRFLSAAKTRPLPTLTSLLNRANGHLRRLRNSSDPKDNGAAVAFDKRLQELHGLLEAPLPKHLGLEDQGWFVLGYYQQKAADREAARNKQNSQTDDN